MAASSQSYNSQALNLQLGAQEVPGGAVFGGGRLVYGYRHGGHLCYITCTPPSGQDPWTNVLASKNWQKYWSQKDTGIDMRAGLSMPAVSFPDPNTAAADVYILSGNSYIFRLNGADNSVVGFQLASASGASLSSVGATAWGTNLLVGWWNQAKNTLTLETYDTTSLPSPIPSNFVWKPAGEASGTPSNFQLPNGATLPSDAFGPVASMDWYSLGGDEFYLVTSFMPDQKNSTPNILVTPMGSGPLPALNSQGVFPTQLVQGFPAGTTQVMVARDAAGRMTLSTCYKSSELMVVIPGDTDPASAWSSASDLNSWTKIAPQVNNGAQPAVSTWAMGSPYSYTYTNGNTTTRQDIFQVSLLADSNGTILCDIQSFGIAEQVPNAVTGQLLPQDPPYKAGNTTYTGVVTGIFDAPFPMPASNVQNNNVAAGTVLGAVVYGSSQRSETQRSTDFSVGWGFSSSYQTTAGGGPAWNISFQAGSTSNSGSDTYSALLDATSIQTRVEPGGNIIPYGSVQSSNVIYTGTCYRVLDVNGDPLPGSPVVCTIIPTLSGVVSTSFNPYLVVPGDVSSYTKEKINARASQLGLLRSGETDYVADVIEKSALSFPQNQNYLLWSQTADSQSAQGYLTSTEQWRETGWYLNSSIYTGIDTGTTLSLGPVSLWGFELQDLSGVNLSASHSVTTDQSTQVQLSVDSMQIPLPVAGADIASMTVRIYFLPSNARWIQELKDHSGLTLTDVNSSPWRVFFLVTAYESKDGKTSYSMPS